MKENVLRVLMAMPCSYQGSLVSVEFYNIFMGKNLEVVGVCDGLNAAREVHDNQFDLILVDQKLEYFKIFEVTLSVVKGNEDIIFFNSEKDRFKFITKKGFLFGVSKSLEDAANTFLESRFKKGVCYESFDCR